MKMIIDKKNENNKFEATSNQKNTDINIDEVKEIDLTLLIQNESFLQKLTERKNLLFHL